eukprot:2799563-Pyramimonas_sp.AAC.1
MIRHGNVPIPILLSWELVGLSLSSLCIDVTWHCLWLVIGRLRRLRRLTEEKQRGGGIRRKKGRGASIDEPHGGPPTM